MAKLLAPGSDGAGTHALPGLMLWPPFACVVAMVPAAVVVVEVAVAVTVVSRGVADSAPDMGGAISIVAAAGMLCSTKLAIAWVSGLDVRGAKRKPVFLPAGMGVFRGSVWSRVSRMNRRSGVGRGCLEGWLLLGE